jgi:hypothetical protein
MSENWLRRHAVQIAAQLPEDPNDALAVLELTRSLVETFLKEPQPRDLDLSANVVDFPASSSSR